MDDNYFLLLGGAERRPPGGGRSPPAARSFRFLNIDSGRWESGKPAFGFPRFPQPRHFHSSFPSQFLALESRRLSSLTVGLVFCLLFLLGVLHPVARDVQLDDHAMMHQSVDRRCRHHRVFEDRLPF
jgi:hypothetical protein